MPLRLTEAQQLYDGLNDPLLRPALAAFFEEQEKQAVSDLLRSVRQKIRDTMREASCAGKAEAFETMMSELDKFADRQLKQAKE